MILKKNLHEWIYILIHLSCFQTVEKFSSISIAFKTHFSSFPTRAILCSFSHDHDWVFNPNLKFFYKQVGRYLREETAKAGKGFKNISIFIF